MVKSVSRDHIIITSNTLDDVIMMMTPVQIGKDRDKLKF